MCTLVVKGGEWATRLIQRGGEVNPPLRAAFPQSEEARVMAQAGFAEGRIHGWTGYRTSSCTEGALVSARKPTVDKQGEEQPR